MNPDIDKKDNSICPGCGVKLRCGVIAGETTCWCMELPPSGLVSTKNASCYCLDCLTLKAIKQSAVAAAT